MRLVRKDLVHSHIVGRKPRLANFCTALLGLILSKKPEISNKRRAPALLVALVAWMWCTRVATTSTAQ